MADIDGTLSFEYSLFRGLNTRDDENHLPYGQTPNAQNFEITRKTGLKKKKGFENPYDVYDMSFAFSGGTNYRDKNNRPYYLSITYPRLYLHDRDNGFPTLLTDSLFSYGKPYFFPCSIGKTIMVDGANKPLLVDNGVATTITWPPSYVVNNSDVLDESINAGEPNPTTLGSDIGFPAFGVSYANRAWLTGDPLAPQRIYVSKMFDYANFGGNSISDFDTAFFVDVQTTSPITGLAVISNKFLVIYCEREIHTLSGSFPPGQNWPQPQFQIDELNSEVGCLGATLIARKGNNDHFYVANDGVVYNLNNTDNFEDIRPRGLSSKIFTKISGLDNDTLKRGYLVNSGNKGELQFWTPSANNLAYPDQRLIFNYSDSAGGEEEWSLDTKFGDLSLRSVFVDDETRDVILISRDRFLIDDRSLTYDGAAIDMLYQLTTMDFGDADKRKEILNITINATNKGESVTNLFLYHLWENGQSGYTKFEIPPVTQSEYGNSSFGEAVFSSIAGTPFTKVEKQPSNHIGKVFKCKIRHQGEADLFVHSIIFRYRIIGK